jgi:hypothetical protein
MSIKKSLFTQENNYSLKKIVSIITWNIFKSTITLIIYIIYLPYNGISNLIDNLRSK